MSAANPNLLGPIPLGTPITDKRVSPIWQLWFSQLFGVAKALGGYGTTANRPISGLYIGQDYFDQTLGYKVTVKSLNPTVWVNGAGGVV